MYILIIAKTLAGFIYFHHVKNTVGITKLETQCYAIFKYFSRESVQLEIICPNCIQSLTLNDWEKIRFFKQILYSCIFKPYSSSYSRHGIIPYHLCHQNWHRYTPQAMFLTDRTCTLLKEKIKMSNYLITIQSNLLFPVTDRCTPMLK